MTDFNDGEDVWYDDNPLVVVRRTSDSPSGAAMYLVSWAGGERQTVVFGSDLMTQREREALR